MEITVTIPDELAARVEARGFVFETFVRNLVEEKLAQEHAVTNGRQKAVEAMLQFADKHGFTTGGQDLESMTHEGHKY